MSELATIANVEQPLTEIKARFRRALSRIETAMQDSYEEREAYILQLEKDIVKQHEAIMEMASVLDSLASAVRKELSRKPGKAEK